MLPFITMFITLNAFEYVAWLSPYKDIFQRLSSRYFYSCNPYYIPRVGILLAVLMVFQPSLWSPFKGGLNWLYSLIMGLILCLVSLKNPQLKVHIRAGLWKKVREIHNTNPKQFWMTTAYMLIYTGLVEEMIFRWFFIAALQPYIGWWVIVVEPLICTLWHYPVILSQPWMYTGESKLNWQGLLGWSSQAFVIGFLFTVVSITTRNISGAIIAHSFSNWLSILDQQA